MSGAAADVRRRVEALPADGLALLAERLAGARPKRLLAWVVPSGATRTPDATDLDAFLRERLPEWMVPADIVMLDAIPRLPNGKVDVNALPAPAAQARAAGFVAPRNDIEAALAAVWARVLGIDSVSANDNFFEVGGDSILSIQVVAHARRLGIGLRPDHIFEHQTLAELAAVATAGAAHVDVEPAVGPVPLTPIQAWFFEQPLPEPHHWHQVVWLEVRAGPAEQKDRPASGDAGGTAAGTAARTNVVRWLEEAMTAVIAHHDALRMRFSRDAEGWRQVPLEEPPPVKLERIDGSDAVERDGLHVVLDRVTRDLAAGTDLDDGSTVRAALVETGPDRAPILVLAIHHLVVDPLSWNVLLEDLESAFEQRSCGLEITLPAGTTSWAAWARSLNRHARSGTPHSESDYWLRLADAGDGIPRDREDLFTEASADTVEASLTREETGLLQDANGAYGTRTDELLLAALGRVISDWSGNARIRVGIERHGRETIVDGIDVSRTVGWFTSYFPVTFDAGGPGDPGAAIRMVKEVMRGVPSGGITYGLLRYQGDGPVAEILRSLPEPELIFNYTGRVDGAALARTLRPIRPPHGSRGDANRRAHLLEVNAFVLDGILRVHWSYGASLHDRTTVERLAAAHVGQLRTLMAHCLSDEAGGYTPSDFPDAGLTQDELDRLIQGLES